MDVSHTPGEGRPALLAHRKILNSRKAVATFVRAFPNGSEDYLRAFFVDERCAFLDSILLARCSSEIPRVEAAFLFDKAMLAGASAIILARGVHFSTTALPRGERSRADALYKQAKRIGIHLLDYIIVDQAESKGLFSLQSTSTVGRP